MRSCHVDTCTFCSGLCSSPAHPLAQHSTVSYSQLPRTYQQHLHWQQVDENHPLVLLAGAMAVFKGKRQVLLSCREQALTSDLSTQPSMLAPAYSTMALVP